MACENVCVAITVVGVQENPVHACVTLINMCAPSRAGGTRQSVRHTPHIEARQVTGGHRPAVGARRAQERQSKLLGKPRANGRYGRSSSTGRGHARGRTPRPPTGCLRRARRRVNRTGHPPGRDDPRARTTPRTSPPHAPAVTGLMAVLLGQLECGCRRRCVRAW